MDLLRFPPAAAAAVPVSSCQVVAQRAREALIALRGWQGTLPDS